MEELIKEYIDLKIEDAFNFEEYNKILITCHSTRIEGSTITFEEADELIRNGFTPGGKPIDFSLAVLDHYKALEFILGKAKEKCTFSIEFIQEIATKVMKSTGGIYNNALGVIDVSKGDLRNTSVRAGSAVFMNHQKVKPALKDLVDTINDELPRQDSIEDKLKLTFYAHYELVNIHPFLDGNGRTSRLVMNFLQKQYDLPLSTIFSEDKPDYYKALNSVERDEKFDKYYAFMFDQYRKKLQTEINKVKNIDLGNKKRGFRR